MTARAETLAVLQEIAAERDRQEESHGFGPEHDDQHGEAEWAWLLGNRVHQLACPWNEVLGLDPRRALVEVAAIAVAAVESLERKARDAAPIDADS